MREVGKAPHRSNSTRHGPRRSVHLGLTLSAAGAAVVVVAAAGWGMDMFWREYGLKLPGNLAAKQVWISAAQAERGPLPERLMQPDFVAEREVARDLVIEHARPTRRGPW